MDTIIIITKQVILLYRKKSIYFYSFGLKYSSFVIIQIKHHLKYRNRREVITILVLSFAYSA